MRKTFVPIALVMGALWVGGPINAQSPTAQSIATQSNKTSPSTNPMTPIAFEGYLPASAIPSSAALVQPPPAAGSSAMARDEEISRGATAMYGTSRWEVAIRDSVLMFPEVAKTFSCAVNAPISEERTPRLMTLLKRTLVDAGRATAEAKQLYKRTRPFVSNGRPICTPDREEALRHDGSYPSGHASIGWAFALVLSEVSPAEENAILARGRAFGQSRLVCNLHWQSDVLEGQLVGSAVVARLHAERKFRDDVAAARAELAALHAKNKPVDGHCDAETQAIKSWQ